MSKQNIQKRGRPVLTDRQKAESKELKNLFMEHSTEALSTIVSIMENSMNSSNRLKAGIYILDKVTPKTYEEDDTQEYTPNVTINLVSHKTKPTLTYEEQEELIKAVEADDEEWMQEDDDWGSEAYLGD